MTYCYIYGEELKNCQNLFLILLNNSIKYDKIWSKQVLLFWITLVTESCLIRCIAARIVILGYCMGKQWFVFASVNTCNMYYLIGYCNTCISHFKYISLFFYFIHTHAPVIFLQMVRFQCMRRLLKKSNLYKIIYSFHLHVICPYDIKHYIISY